MFDELNQGGERAWRPAIDVVRQNDNLVLRADVPGIKPDEVKIEVEVEDDILTVSGQHQETKKKDGELRQSRASLGVVFALDGRPPGVDANEIKAITHDGVVEVTIPLPEEAKKQKLEITPTAA